MKGRFFNYLPVSVYAAKAGLTVEERQLIIDQIDESFTKVDRSNSESTWTGDVHGFHELHNHPTYLRLFGIIGEQVREYISGLQINEHLFDYYYTRSWATKQVQDKMIAHHRHEQSHISVVYYPSVPEQSGDFYVATDNHQNEIITGLFREEQYKKGVVKSGSQLSSAELPIKVEDDLILIFPSKTAHRTGISQSSSPRYSIATDIMCILKNANDWEIGLPPIHTWRKC